MECPLDSICSSICTNQNDWQASWHPGAVFRDGQKLLFARLILFPAGHVQRQHGIPARVIDGRLTADNHRVQEVLAGGVIRVPEVKLFNGLLGLKDDALKALL